MEYNHKQIEEKWQKIWAEKRMFEAEDFSKKPKYYALVEFPYPSGTGMHVGHLRAYSAMEVISRKRRMEGYNVLFPIGFDAFGLPTENQAIKDKVQPRKVTDRNIAQFTEELKRGGYSFDYSRTVDTTEQNFYHWTQWIFLKLYEHKLAYKSKTFVNFCPECKVVLANEESQGGKCDRCESDVVQMEKDVWFLKISEYAEKLLETLPELDFLPRIKSEQENWIGKSTGAYVDFKVVDTPHQLRVFTTRPDTLFGVTFMVVAPEHPILQTESKRIHNWEEIEAYQEEAHRKTEFERVHVNKEKTGVLLQGLRGINPMTGEELPIFVADYVMIGYGTGAIMAVPGHDTRDYEFAQAYGLPIREVIQGGNIAKEAFTDIEEGRLINSGFLDGKSVKEAKEAMIQYLEEHNIGEKTTNYKMKDWAFNRQRYWGEPIPIIYCNQCGEVPVPYEDLPVVLPETSNIVPTNTGESPLANVEEFMNCTCPKCGGKAKRETDTMPQWAGSSWYFLRYCDPHNTGKFADIEKLKYWMPVDWYSGGMEHVTRHLIYSRFWHRFLSDIGEVNTPEPYKKRTAQGLFLASDGTKMSKSKGNTAFAKDAIREHGADALRLCILFIGDYEQSTPWNDNGVKGTRRFIERVWRLLETVDMKAKGYSPSLEVLINQTIKKVSENYEELKFNTGIASLMTLVNEYYTQERITKQDYEVLIKLLYPVAPHFTEELNELLGNQESLVFSSWPLVDENKLQADTVTLIVQVNGKLRDRIETPLNALESEAVELALKSERVKEFTDGKEIIKRILVPNKLLNIVVK